MNLSILEKELQFSTARSGGSGGQHVNKVETKVVLYFDVEGSTNLSNKEKYFIKRNLASQINKEGQLILTSESTRSQYRNKERVVAKWKALMSAALKRKKKRIPTKRPKKAIDAIRKAKSKRSEIKKWRKSPKHDY
jgi:ribosome-associated protein